MKQIPLEIMIALIIVALFLHGCMLASIHQLNRDDATLSPEQIKAYKELGMDVYGCFKIGGPPVGGNTIWIVAPKNSKLMPNFGDDCHILPTPLGALQ